MTVTLDLFSFAFGFVGGVICTILFLCLLVLGSIPKVKP